MKRAKVWKMGKVCQNTKPTHLMSSVFFLTNYKVLFTSTNNYLLYHVLLIATN